MRRPQGAYERWIEQHGANAVYLYAAFIVVLMPAFHFVLQQLPGTPPDSLAIRLVAAGWSLATAGALYLVPPLRRFAEAAQFVNILPTMLIIDVLVIDSGNNYLYIASGLLMIVGAQQAFFRPVPLATAMSIALAFQALYSALAGHFYEPTNLTALAIYATAYLLAFIPAAYRMAIQRRELITRLAAQRLARKLDARERALRESQARLSEVHAMTHLGNWNRDLDDGSVECSPEMLRMLGVPFDTPRHALRNVYERFVHPEDRETVERAVERARNDGLPFDIDHRLMLADDRILWVHLHGKYEYDEAGNATRLVAAVLDISRRKDAEESLKRIASTDALTGLPNRASLQRRLQRAIGAAVSSRDRGAVFFLDLDHFKDINDTLGHAVGDVLLRAASARLSSALPEDGFIARWGGDEFVVVIPRLARDPSELAEELANLFEAPFAIDGYELNVSASVGISIFPEDAVEPTILIRNADTAMYRAKEERGHGSRRFEPAMYDEARVRHRVQNELRRAISNDRFVLHYQPIVETSSARMTGVEALLRLRGADDTLVAPSQFIGIAEETGSIVAIGAWVLDEACRQLVRWKNAGIETRISVNISARHFTHPGFIPNVSRAIELSGADPAMLDIEVTETTLMRNVEIVRSVLERLHAMGTSVSVDDFGTGYSSLAYLRQFDLDALKLDHTFVSAVGNAQQRVIARSIIRIAHTLGMQVTAEGVETQRQYDILDALRCDKLQGFHVARPMPAGELERLIATTNGSALVQPPALTRTRVARLPATGA